MTRELEHFTVDGLYGWDQERFTDWWMNRGGCGAVTACDVCIYLARNKDMPGLYPFDPAEITPEDYLAFAEIMKPYLRPRPRGINSTAIYMEGFREYLETRPGPRPQMRSVEGGESAQTAVAAVKDALDRGFPVPYLMLLHEDKTLDDYNWHWFLLNGYEERPDAFMVKVVTYGEWVWMDLLHLWNTGHEEKGGFVVLYE